MGRVLDEAERRLKEAHFLVPLHTSNAILGGENARQAEGDRGRRAVRWPAISTTPLPSARAPIPAHGTSVRIDAWHPQAAGK
jgi:hypothetical protein